MGLTLRRVEEGHHFHRRLHDFSESIEHALIAILLIALGSVLTLLFVDLKWRHVLIALVLIMAVRPLSELIALFKADLQFPDKIVVSAYGVSGIGSIYYLCYAGSHMAFTNEVQIWSLVALVILLSTILHCFSMGWAMGKLKDET